MNNVIKINVYKDIKNDELLKSDVVFKNNTDIKEMCEYIGGLIKDGIYVITAKTEDNHKSIYVNGYKDISEFSDNECHESWKEYCLNENPWSEFNEKYYNDFTPEEIID